MEANEIILPEVYVLIQDLPHIKAGAKYKLIHKNCRCLHYQLDEESSEQHIFNCSKNEWNYWGAYGYIFDIYTVTQSPEWFKSLNKIEQEQLNTEYNQKISTILESLHSLVKELEDAII